MEVGEKIDILSSFVNGIGKQDTVDINNSLFIAKKLYHLDIGYRFKDYGEFGVINYALCENLMGIRKVSNHRDVFKIGEKLSKYDSDELKYLAKHLYNMKSGLFPKEREIAANILKNDFSESLVSR